MPVKWTLIAALALSAACSPAHSADRPDILMIVVDDLRPMLGCYGDQRVHTPNIDRLAESGVVFERAYCQYAKCGTSRLSMMTGLRPDAMGVFSNNDKDVKAFRSRRPDAVSLAATLKANGYHTQSFGKIYHDGWDLASDWSVPSQPGRPREMWEIVDETKPHAPTIIADRLQCPVQQNPDVDDDHLFAGRMTSRVVHIIRSQNASLQKPGFLAVGYRRPHLPFVAPKRYFDLYDPDETWLATNPDPPVGSPVKAWYNSDGYTGSARKVGLKMPGRPSADEAVGWNGYEMRSYLGVPNHGEIHAEMQRELLRAYAACVTYVDAQIGRLLDALQSSNRLDNTLIVLCSDHGWHLGEQSAWGKMTNFEVACRVPLIVAGPGISPGRTRTLAELVDLYPTLCELTQIDTPSHLQGRSLVPTLQRPSGPSAAVATSQYSRFGNQFMGRALRTDRYRYVAWTDTRSGEVVEQELYDHRSDPKETRNLADDKVHEQLAGDLHRRLETARAANGEPELSYFLIGNSLTWDTVPSRLDGNVKWHVDCGKSLPFIFEHPEAPCVKSSSLWPAALKDHQYDFVSVQPHYGSTIHDDVTVISNWVAMQRHAIFVIHTGWAHQEKRADEYRNPDTSGNMQHSPAYIETLISELQKAFPEREFRQTHAIDLLQKVAADVENQKAPFAAVSFLHRDRIHMTLNHGRYLMHNAMRHALGQSRSATGFEHMNAAAHRYLDSVLDSLPQD